MASRLINILTFTDVAAGGTVSQAHSLNSNGVALIPDFMAADASGFTVTADNTNVTVTNDGADPATVHVWAEYKHSMLRVFGNVQTTQLTPAPFVAAVGGSGGGGSSIFIEGDGAGSAIQDNTTGNAATGENSTICGENNQLSGPGSFAEGVGNTEAITSTGASSGGANHLEGNSNSISVAQADSGGFNHVEGNNNTLSATETGACGFNHVEGNNNTLSAPASAVEFNHVEGDGNSLTANSPNQCSFNHVEGSGNALTDISDSHVEGSSHTINANGGTENHIEGDSHAFGNGVTDINSAHVEGRENTVLSDGTYRADICHVEGQSAGGFMHETQFAKASGSFSTDGDAQMCNLVMRASTPGVGAGESAELMFGDNQNRQLVLQDNKGYVITVDAVARSGDIVRTFKQTFAVRRTGGTTTIAQAGTQEALGDAGGNSWTLDATVGAGPDRFALTFDTGADTAGVRCVAAVRWVEVSI